MGKRGTIEEFSGDFRRVRGKLSYFCSQLNSIPHHGLLICLSWAGLGAIGLFRTEIVGGPLSSFSTHICWRGNALFGRSLRAKPHTHSLAQTLDPSLTRYIWIQASRLDHLFYIHGRFLRVQFLESWVVQRNDEQAEEMIQNLQCRPSRQLTRTEWKYLTKIRPVCPYDELALRAEAKLHRHWAYRQGPQRVHRALHRAARWVGLPWLVSEPSSLTYEAWVKSLVPHTLIPPPLITYRTVPGFRPDGRPDGSAPLLGPNTLDEVLAFWNRLEQRETVPGIKPSPLPPVWRLQVAGQANSAQPQLLPSCQFSQKGQLTPAYWT